MKPEDIQRLRELEAKTHVATVKFTGRDGNPAIRLKTTRETDSEYEEMRNALPELLDDWERMREEIGELREQNKLLSAAVQAYEQDLALP